MTSKQKRLTIAAVIVVAIVILFLFRKRMTAATNNMVQRAETNSITNGAGAIAPTSISMNLPPLDYVSGNRTINYTGSTINLNSGCSICSTFGGNNILPASTPDKIAAPTATPVNYNAPPVNYSTTPLIGAYGSQSLF